MLSLAHHAGTSASPLDETLQRITELVIGAMRATRGSIYLRDRSGEFKLRYSHGDKASRHEDEIATSAISEHLPLIAVDGRLMLSPLSSGNQWSGIICIARADGERPFAPTDLGLLKTLADSSALAIANAQAHADAHAQLVNLRLLHEISADLTSTLDLERVLTACLERVKNVLQVESATILIREGSELVFRIAIGETAERIKPFRLKIGQGITGWVAQHARGDYTNDVQHDPRYYGGVDASLDIITHSLAAAPLIVNDRLIGVLSATNKPGGFGPADLELLLTIAGSAAIAIENARLYEVAVEKGRMEHELQVAHQVQASLIPRDTPRLQGWDIAAMWHPAREVSGDYYDFIPSNRQLDLVIADVSDKGMPAALLMAHTRSVIRASLAPARSVAQGITRANEWISANAANDMFVTMCCARLQARSGKVVCVNAGHSRPLVYRAGQDALTEIVRSGVALGMQPGSRFGERVEHLRRGDFLLFYTDGVPDAENAKGDMFGEERLGQIAMQNGRARAGQIIASLERALAMFTGSAPRTDDITALVVKKL